MRVVLGPRDHLLLSAVARMGVLSTRQVMRLGFGDRPRARNTVNKRLRKLTVASYLRASRPGGLGKDLLFTLGPEGRRALAERGEQVIAAAPRLAGWPAHALAVSDVRIAVAVACKESGTIELITFSSDLELARDGWGQRFAKIPDARVVLARGEHETTFFFELDLGGEAHATFEARHLRRYAELNARVGSVVVLASSFRRMVNLAKTAMRAGLGAFARFAELRSFLRAPFAPVLYRGESIGGMAEDADASNELAAESLL